MEVKLKKWGNSFGIRFNQNIIKELSLKENQSLEIKIIDNKMILLPKKNLNDLISQINENNLHNEVDFGTRGKELL